MTAAAARIAVASKDGLSVNLHFGHAKEFFVYDVSDDAITLLERRKVDHYCHGQTGDQSAMQKILATINDCSAVLVAKIGDGPIAKLSRIGVTAVDEYAYQGVEESLRACADTILSDVSAKEVIA
ncbi:NifB/NifX family molybdenum-iron cluster-binding protein [Pseudomaricurvus sp. HS19]|uniref:NifB/NifX family molybdenum-iron cluster-binding protein n=1 Tax=Pseudomaricurvus sp. HS19 TaxID=2692626 RepID=UPI00137179E4|nr:NifB/NifX family molybdenum-iron cluster-binding protein [Pseudomaricurvus sp. HS19]MYM62283.1 dinitrogenase iron-molybdenum cofactor biosynthesis protein [Pseudomaricurvus sp. HS19]